MYIGELSKRTGATPKAIRLYESLGLIGQVARVGVYRIYSEAQVTQVRLVLIRLSQTPCKTSHEQAIFAAKLL